jgi:hypothetical protein
MASLFSMQNAMKGPKGPMGGSEPGDTGDSEDYSGDLQDPNENSENSDIGAGPFDAYADTVLDAKASPEDRKAALREAILTLIEEQGK